MQEVLETGDIAVHISSEACNYYYSTNTFLLDMTEPTYAPNRFHSGTISLLKYIRPIQTLQLVIGDSFSLDADPCSLSEYSRSRIRHIKIESRALSQVRRYDIASHIMIGR